MLTKEQLYEGNDVLGPDGRHGVIVAIKETRVTMVEVKWSGVTVTSWLHPEQLRVPSALAPPPPVHVSKKGPCLEPMPLRFIANRKEFLVGSTDKDYRRRNRGRERLQANQQLANDLVWLGNQRKSKTKNKAKKLISRWEKGHKPQHTISWHRYEKEILRGGPQGKQTRASRPLEKFVAVTGKTYPIKEQIKRMGGVWNPASHAWMVPQARADEALSLLAKRDESARVTEWSRSERKKLQERIDRDRDREQSPASSPVPF